MQEELAAIAMAVETSTLGVERKRNLDRRSEAARVSSVAKASRDAFVRHWRPEVRAACPTSTQRKQRRANKFANVVSVALEQRPDLFPQAHGKLWWKDVPRGSRKRISDDTGDRRQ